MNSKRPYLMLIMSAIGFAVSIWFIIDNSIINNISLGSTTAIAVASSGISYLFAKNSTQIERGEITSPNLIKWVFAPLMFVMFALYFITHSNYLLYSMLLTGTLSSLLSSLFFIFSIKKTN